MRVAVIFALMPVLATPSEASKFCVENTEAHDVCRTSSLQWHDAMSEMLPDDGTMPPTGQTPWTERWVNIETPRLSPAARGVDKAQDASPPAMERRPVPTVLSRGLVWLAFIAILLTIAIIEILFRGTRRV